jgi:hypothetical protein
MKLNDAEKTIIRGRITDEVQADIESNGIGSFCRASFSDYEFNLDCIFLEWLNLQPWHKGQESSDKDFDAMENACKKVAMHHFSFIQDSMANIFIARGGKS